MRFLAGTKNKDKFAEIKEILEELKIELISAADLNDLPDVEEDAPDIAGNAIKKACEFGRRSKLYTLADDTGLFVESLNGEPGVYSARYAGINCSYADNRNKLLYEMKDSKNRTACFRTVVALADPMGKLIATTEGRVDGEITHQEKGLHGFGYDSIFYSHELKKTFAEMDSEEKHQISHRGRALAKMKLLIRDLIKKEMEG